MIVPLGKLDTNLISPRGEKRGRKAMIAGFLPHKGLQRNVKIEDKDFYNLKAGPGVEKIVTFNKNLFCIR